MKICTKPQISILAAQTTAQHTRRLYLLAAHLSSIKFYDDVKPESVLSSMLIITTLPQLISSHTHRRWLTDLFTATAQNAIFISSNITSRRRTMYEDFIIGFISLAVTTLARSHRIHTHMRWQRITFVAILKDFSGSNVCTLHCCLFVNAMSES
jgi:hypothetical protein